METKKSVKADLERQKTLFFLVGLFVSLLAVYFSFEFIGTRENYESIQWGTGSSDEEIALSPMNFLPPLSQQAMASDVKTVANDVIQTEDFTINAEADEDLKIDDKINPDEGIFTDTLFFDAYANLHGGDENYMKLMKFLQEHLTYPELARQVLLEGKVHIGFTVEKNGYLTNFTILRGVPPVLDNEVLRVLRLMPKWKWNPKEDKDKYVRAHYKIPIIFALK